MYISIYNSKIKSTVNYCIPCTTYINAMSSFSCALPLHAVVSCLANVNDLPAKPANGQRYGSSASFGSTVTYSCDPGYKLIGPSTVTCLANRRWNTSGEAVQCIGKSKCRISMNCNRSFKCINYTIILPGIQM